MTATVWAPRAAKLELAMGGETFPMVRGERGIYRAEVSIPPDTPYGFVVDGQGPFPDPRSEFQPEGVHGPSLRWDHSRQPFRHENFRPRPLAEAVFYELHVGTFSAEGTYEGAIQHLDHLVALGITHVELMPLSAFPGGRGWGYDGVAPFAPHASYGTPDELKRLVDECHGRGLAIVLDVVFNHLGPDGNYLGLYAPYFTDRYRTPWGEAVNLDGPDSDVVRQTLIDVAIAWLELYRFDGLRLDAVHALYDQGAVHFLEQLHDEVRVLERKMNRSLFLVAECDLNDPRYVRPPSQGGLGMEAQWCDEFHHALHSVMTSERDGYYEDFGSLELLAKALRQGYVYDGTWSPHRRRYHGRTPEGVTADQLVVFAQNHDQVGNRAHGERLSQLLGREPLLQVAALTLLSPFVPMVFQGEEWGSQRPFLYFTDHVDEQLGRNVTEGRRREFSYFAAHAGEVPDPQAESTFAASCLDWSELERDDHARLLAWHRRLLEIRREHGLGSPSLEARVSYDEEERWLAMERGRLTLLVNLADRELALRGSGALIPAPLVRGKVLLSSAPDVALGSQDPAALEPHGTLLLEG